MPSPGPAITLPSESAPKGERVGLDRIIHDAVRPYTKLKDLLRDNEFDPYSSEYDGILIGTHPSATRQAFYRQVREETQRPDGIPGTYEVKDEGGHCIMAASPVAVETKEPTDRSSVAREVNIRQALYTEIAKLVTGQYPILLKFSGDKKVLFINKSKPGARRLEFGEVMQTLLTDFQPPELTSQGALTMHLLVFLQQEFYEQVDIFVSENFLPEPISGNREDEHFYHIAVTDYPKIVEEDRRPYSAGGEETVTDMNTDTNPDRINVRVESTEHPYPYTNAVAFAASRIVATAQFDQSFSRVAWNESTQIDDDPLAEIREAVQTPETVRLIGDQEERIGSKSSQVYVLANTPKREGKRRWREVSVEVYDTGNSQKQRELRQRLQVGDVEYVVSAYTGRSYYTLAQQIATRLARIASGMTNGEYMLGENMDVVLAQIPNRTWRERLATAITPMKNRIERRFLRRLHTTWRRNIHAFSSLEDIHEFFSQELERYGINMRVIEAAHVNNQVLARQRATQERLGHLLARRAFVGDEAPMSDGRTISEHIDDLQALLAA